MGGDGLVHHGRHRLGRQGLEAPPAGELGGVAPTVTQQVGKDRLHLGGSQLAGCLHTEERHVGGCGKLPRRLGVRRRLVGRAGERQRSGNALGHGGLHEAIEAQVDDGRHLVGTGATRLEHLVAEERCQLPAPLSGHRWQRGRHRRAPLVVGHDRDQVGLEEVPVVLGLLLRPQRDGRAPVLIPVASLLTHRAAGLEDVDLALRLVLDGAGDRAQGVEVLDLAPGTEHRRPGSPDRHVGVDPHRAFLHLAVGRTGGHQDGPQLGRVGASLGRGAQVGSAYDLDERHARAVVVDQ